MPPLAVPTKTVSPATVVEVGLTAMAVTAPDTVFELAELPVKTWPPMIGAGPSEVQVPMLRSTLSSNCSTGKSRQRGRRRG